MKPSKIGRPPEANPKIVPLRTFVTEETARAWKKKRGKVGVAAALRDLVEAAVSE